MHTQLIHRQQWNNARVPSQNCYERWMSNWWATEVSQKVWIEVLINNTLYPYRRRRRESRSLQVSTNINQLQTHQTTVRNRNIFVQNPYEVLATHTNQPICFSNEQICDSWTLRANWELQSSFTYGGSKINLIVGTFLAKPVFSPVHFFVIPISVQRLL